MRGNFWCVGMLKHHLAPCSARDTRAPLLAAHMSRKCVSSWLDMPDRYVSTDLGLMYVNWKVTWSASVHGVGLMLKP